MRYYGGLRFNSEPFGRQRIKNDNFEGTNVTAGTQWQVEMQHKAL